MILKTKSFALGLIITMRTLSGKNGTYSYSESDFVSAGSFGRVYKCRSATGQTFAVKVIEKQKLDDQGPYLRVALSREIQVQFEVSRSRIPFFVKLFDAFEDEKKFFMVMEFCECTLTSYMRQKPRTVLECLDITFQVGMGLALMHRLGMAHRDIKPDNVLVLGGVMKIADFGFACQQADMRTSLGTPAFMSPELYREDDAQKYTNKVDVWALNHSLYKLLTGRFFFEQPNLKEKILSQPFAVLPEYRKVIDPLTEALLRTGFTKNPAQRPSMLEYLRHEAMSPFHSKYHHFLLEAEGLSQRPPSVSINLSNPITADTKPFTLRPAESPRPRGSPGNAGPKSPEIRKIYGFLETHRLACQVYFEIAKILIANDINRLLALRFIKRGIQRLGVVVLAFKRRQFFETSILKHLSFSPEQWEVICLSPEIIPLVNLYVDTLNKNHSFYRSEYKTCDEILAGQSLPKQPYDLNESVVENLLAFARKFEDFARANHPEIGYEDILRAMLAKVVAMES